MSLDEAVHLFIEAATPPAMHRSGDLDQARQVLERFPDVAGANIYTASVLGEVQKVASFLDEDSSLVTRPGGPREWDPLLYVAFSRFLRLDPDRRPGLHATARLLLDRGADPDTHWLDAEEAQFGRRETAVYGAAGVANDPVLTKMLLDAGADPNDGESPYHSVEHEGLECAALLFEHGLDANGRSMALLHRLDWDDLAGIKRLLDLGADPNHTSPYGKAALHQAILRSRKLAFFELLLERGADPNVRNASGRTAYALAARVGRHDAMDLFGRRGADTSLNAVDTFLAACARGDVRGAEQAIAATPGLMQLLTDEDRAVVVFAAASGNTAGVRLMLDHGFDIETVGDWGGTAVHHAAWHGRADTVELLVERGANLEHVNGYGGTTLDAAAWAVDHSGFNGVDYLPVIEALLKGGADVSKVHPFPTGNDRVDALLKRYGRGA